MAAANVLVAGAKQALQLARNPEVRQQIVEYTKRATGGKAVSSFEDLSNLVTKGIAPASIVLRGAAANGINPDDIFAEHVLRGQADAVAQKIIAELRTVYASNRGRWDSEAGIKYSGTTSNDLYQKGVIKWARGQFSSSQGVREAHAQLRAFLDMDTATVEHLLALHYGPI